ncbi:MAG: HigA family addiction module antitoxin, partial [Alphaproteobacteria bacterium]
MTPLGVSRNKLARDIDVPVGRISDVVAGKRGVTPDTALRFAKYFGTTAELWLRLQADYDLYVARTTSWPEAEPKVSVFEPANGGVVDDTPSAYADQPSASPEPVPEATAVMADTPPAVVVDNSDAGTDEKSSDADERLPSEIDLDDGNIDIPEPVSPKA